MRDRGLNPKRFVFMGSGVADSERGQSTYNPLGSGGKARYSEAHTAPKKFGMGDYYGTGFKAPVGKVREATVGFKPVNQSQLGTPPKSLA